MLFFSFRCTVIANSWFLLFWLLFRFSDNAPFLSVSCFVLHRLIYYLSQNDFIGLWAPTAAKCCGCPGQDTLEEISDLSGTDVEKCGSNTEINKCVETFLTWISATMFSSGFRWRVKASLISRTPSNSTSTSTTCSLSPSLNSISAHTDTKRVVLLTVCVGTCVRRWFPEI